MFDGSLGFTLEVEFVSYPALALPVPRPGEPFHPQEALSSNALPCSIALPPAEEAYSVYDHPTVYIFRKTEQYSRAKAQLLLLESLTDAVRFVTPREATSADSGEANRWLPLRASGQSKKPAVRGRGCSIGMRCRIASRVWGSYCGRPWSHCWAGWPIRGFRPWCRI